MKTPTDVHESTPTRKSPRPALLLLALAGLAVSLLACRPSGVDPTGDSVATLSSTSAGGLASPTPSFPPFTIGAWTSDAMPSAQDRVAIYVICQAQDPSMARPSAPVAGLNVRVNLLDPVHGSHLGTTIGTTGSNGVALVHVTVTGSLPPRGVPVIVEVTTKWHGVTYQSETSFTPASRSGAPFSPSTSGKGSGDGGSGQRPAPTPVPQATPPAPNPTPTPAPPAPTPTPTALPQPTAT